MQLTLYQDSVSFTDHVHSWMEDNAHLAPFTKNHPKPGEKLAAYLMGRWKNGLSRPSVTLTMGPGSLTKTSRNPCG
jgi:hypothetical protein